MIEKPTADEFEEAFKQLVAAGLARDTGKRRRGRVVYAITEEGQRMLDMGVTTEQ